MPAQAGAAGGGGNGAAGFHESLDIAFFNGLQIDLLGGGDDNGPNAFRHLPPAEDLRRRFDILQPSVGAGADDALLNGNFF